MTNVGCPRSVAGLPQARQPCAVARNDIVVSCNGRNLGVLLIPLSWLGSVRVRVVGYLLLAGRSFLGQSK